MPSASILVESPVSEFAPLGTLKQAKTITKGERVQNIASVAVWLICKRQGKHGSIATLLVWALEAIVMQYAVVHQENIAADVERMRVVAVDATMSRKAKMDCSKRIVAKRLQHGSDTRTAFAGHVKRIQNLVRGMDAETVSVAALSVL